MIFLIQNFSIDIKVSQRVMKNEVSLFGIWYSSSGHDLVSFRWEVVLKFRSEASTNLCLDRCKLRWIYVTQSKQNVSLEKSKSGLVYQRWPSPATFKFILVFNQHYNFFQQINKNNFLYGVRRWDSNSWTPLDPITTRPWLPYWVCISSVVNLFGISLERILLLEDENYGWG